MPPKPVKTVIQNLHLHISSSDDVEAAINALLHSQNIHVQQVHRTSKEHGKMIQKNTHRVFKKKKGGVPHGQGTSDTARRRRNMQARFQQAVKTYPGQSVCIATALPHDINEAEIKEFFTKTAGPVANVKLEREPGRSKASRGIAYITFKDAKVAATAVRELDGVLVDGRRIRVLAVPKWVDKFAQPSAARPAVPEKNYASVQDPSAARPAVPEKNYASFRDPQAGRLGFADKEMLKGVPNIDLERAETGGEELAQVQTEAQVQVQVQEIPRNEEEVSQGQGTSCEHGEVIENKGDGNLMEMKEGEVLAQSLVQVQGPENDGMQNQGVSEGTEQVNLMEMEEGEIQDVNVGDQGSEVMDLDVAEDLILGHLGLMSRSDETQVV